MASRPLPGRRRLRPQLCQQLACRDKVVRFESICERGVDAGRQLASFVFLPFASEVAGEAQCCAQLERGRAVAARQFERLAQTVLGLTARAEP